MDTASLAAAPAAVAARDETKDERRKRKEKERGQRRNHSGRKQWSGCQKRKRQESLAEERAVAAEAAEAVAKQAVAEQGAFTPACSPVKVSAVSETRGWRHGCGLAMHVCQGRCDR